MSIWELPLKLVTLLFFVAVANSCSGSSVEFVYDLNQPINFVMTDSLQTALDAPGRQLYANAANHAAEALGVPFGWGHDLDHPGGELLTDNPMVYLTLGDVDCTGDRAGYVRWRPNNVLEICPSMIHEHSYLLAVSLIMHEIGHVIGANHVPCDGESIMAPDLNCPTHRYDRAAPNPDALFWYSDTDVKEICQHTDGGLCRP